MGFALNGNWDTINHHNRLGLYGDNREEQIGEVK